MSTAALGSGLLAGLTVLLLLRPPVGRVPAVERVCGLTSRARTAQLLGLSGAAAGALLVSVRGTTLALALIVLTVGAGVGQLAVRGRLRREAAARRTEVVEVGEVLAGELGAGQPPATALARAAEAWPALTSVVVASELGADVPAALRRLAGMPGAEGLRDLASGWEVSERSGAALSTVVSEVVESGRARQAAQHAVRAELASAQATARMVAVLPLLTLGLSSSLGSQAWGFLLADPVGLVCLAGGAGLVIGGLFWMDRIATSAVA